MIAINLMSTSNAKMWKQTGVVAVVVNLAIFFSFIPITHAVVGFSAFLGFLGTEKLYDQRVTQSLNVMNAEFRKYFVCIIYTIDISLFFQRG